MFRAAINEQDQRINLVSSEHRDAPNRSMEKFLTAVRTAHGRAGETDQDELITTVSSRSTAKPRLSTPLSGNAPSSSVLKHASNPQEALHVLRDKPDIESLILILRQLTSLDGFQDRFTLHASSPTQAQILTTLLNSIVPIFWSTLTEPDRLLLVSVLSNVHGVIAVIGKVRFITNEVTQHGNAVLLSELLSLSKYLFQGDDITTKLWIGLHADHTAIKRTVAWKEIVSLLGSGKVTGTVAQAENALRSSRSNVALEPSWLSNGPEYASWLGRNIARMNRIAEPSISSHDSHTAAAQLLAKALNLGYPVPLVSMFLSSSKTDTSFGLGALVGQLPAHAQRALLEYTLQWLSSLTVGDHSWSMPDQPLNDEVAAFAAQISALSKSAAGLSSLLDSMLSDIAIMASTSFVVRRACFAVISSTNPENLTSLFEVMSSMFGDPLFIAHAPLSQQEAMTQNLLLAAGYLHRASPMAVLMTARSSGHMQGVSNRLDTSNQRARWLGMVAGTAISGLVDRPGMTALNFGTDDMDTLEARWYLNLVNFQDTVGAHSDIERLLQKLRNFDSKKQKFKVHKEEMPILHGKPMFGPVRPPQIVPADVTENRISEVLDSDKVAAESNILKPHSKPDSDPEDSDDDATMINRSKPRPPVYVRDLMRMIQDDKEPARFEMGMEHAAALIRRKANFGNEVKDHANELLSMLSNLQDPFATAGFDEKRLQTMIAVFVSDPSTLGPHISNRVFSGDFSISQRCMMLSTIGLGGRELAGFQSQDDLNPIAIAAKETFPSKQLPPQLHSLYSGSIFPVKRLEVTSADVERSLVQPMALRAADQQTAELNAVKVRTFSSRIALERTKRKPAANKLAQILGQTIFHPLLSRYEQEITSYGSASVWSSTPILIVTLVKTLAILLHAAGAATADLRDITVAFWRFLHRLRVAAVGDIAILSSVLFALLTLLEVNTTTTSAQQRLAEECAKELAQTQQWAEVVFERLGGGNVVDNSAGRNEEARVRALAAGVLVKTQEVVATYQRQLFGAPLG
nr:dna replication checkpoint protein tel2 [Quercus suber]